MSGVGGSDLVIDHLFLVYDLFLDVVLDSSFMLIVGLIGDGGHVEPLAWSVDVMIQQMALYVSVFVFIIHPGANCLPDWRAFWPSSSKYMVALFFPAFTTFRVFHQPTTFPTAPFTPLTTLPTSALPFSQIHFATFSSTPRTLSLIFCIASRILLVIPVRRS